MARPRSLPWRYAQDPAVLLRHSTCDNWVCTRFALRSLPPNKTSEFRRTIGDSDKISLGRPAYATVAVAIVIPINTLTPDTQQSEIPL